MLNMPGTIGDLSLVRSEPSYNAGKKLIQFRIRDSNLNAEIEFGGEFLSFGSLASDPKNFRPGLWYYV